MEADLAGLVLLGRYRLGHRLARGGMADVYAATDLRLGRSVAVKIPHPHLAADPDFRERLRREAQAIAALSHPNIVGVYDQDEAEGRPFLVMELVAGESLGDLLARQGFLSPEHALGILQDVLAALEQAHSHGIVHRDVKPQNVLITTEGPAKLADFGIAQAAAAAAITQGGEVLGTLHYLAPERLTGQLATPATDLYSVGVVLYQMLTGRLPFEGDVTATVIAQHLHGEPTPPATLRPELPLWLSEFVLRALAKDPNDRYPSAAAMLEYLARRRAAANVAPTTALALAPVTPLPLRRIVRGEVARILSVPRLGLYAGVLGAALLLAVLGFTYVVTSWRLGREPAALLTTTPAILTSASIPSSPTASRTTPTTSGATRTPASVAPTLVPTSTPATPTATSRAPTPTTNPPTQQPAQPSVRQRLIALQTLVESARTAGDKGKDGKEERDILKKLEEIEQKVVGGDPGSAGRLTEDLIRQVRDMDRKGTIDHELADQLLTQLTALANQFR